jgi:cytosine/adenosine deaminase-related metal-dependent hydrolase
MRDEWVPTADGLLTVGVNVRGPSRSSAEVYRFEFARARELGLPIAMHCAGTRKEVERIHQVAILAEEGLLADDLMLAHCNWLPADEMALCARHGVPVSISPVVELRLGMGTPKVRELHDAGVVVSLSLDTTAIAAAADPFVQMRLALGLENARHEDALSLRPRDVLRMATLDGARTLGLDRITGSITPGKRADIVLIDVDRLNTVPVVDPAVAVVHSAAPSNVSTVIVDGRVLVRDGRLLTADTDAIVAEAASRLAALADRAGFELTAAPPGSRG